MWACAQQGMLWVMCVWPHLCWDTAPGGTVSGPLWRGVVLCQGRWLGPRNQWQQLRLPCVCSCAGKGLLEKPSCKAWSG